MTNPALQKGRDGSPRRGATWRPAPLRRRLMRATVRGAPPSAIRRRRRPRVAIRWHASEHGARHRVQGAERFAAGIGRRASLHGAV